MLPSDVVLFVTDSIKEWGQRRLPGFNVCQCISYSQALSQSGLDCQALRRTALLCRTAGHNLTEQQAQAPRRRRRLSMIPTPNQSVVLHMDPSPPKNLAAEKLDWGINLS